jgi:inward rectifier potassium channel
MKVEIIVLLKAFDDTFSQTVYSRTSYHFNEILWGKRFLPMFNVKPNGQTILNLSKIDLMEDKELIFETVPSTESNNYN